MAEVSFSIQMDENLKEQFEQVCSDLGMSVSMAITIFARMVVRERKIPFEIAASLASTTREDGLNAFLALREEAHRNGLQDMTLDDINTEIQQTRTERYGARTCRYYPAGTLRHSRDPAAKAAGSAHARQPAL